MQIEQFKKIGNTQQMAYTYMLKKYNEDRDKHNAIVTKLKKAKEELKRSTCIP